MCFRIVPFSWPPSLFLPSFLRAEEIPRNLQTRQTRLLTLTVLQFSIYSRCPGPWLHTGILGPPQSGWLPVERGAIWAAAFLKACQLFLTVNLIFLTPSLLNHFLLGTLSLTQEHPCLLSKTMSHRDRNDSCLVGTFSHLDTSSYDSFLAIFFFFFF